MSDVSIYFANAIKALHLPSVNIDTAIILGSGWLDATRELGTVVASVDATYYGFPKSTVSGHSGKLAVLKTDTGKHILLIGARSHWYERRNMEDVVRPVQFAHAFGIKNLILTNASGSVNGPGHSPGQVVLIQDHINLTGVSPLDADPNIDNKFIDLTRLYWHDTSYKIANLARLNTAIYAMMPGPHYETSAEVNYLTRIGVDIVGMSTALEAIEARRLGMEVIGLSLITNYAAGVGGVNHSDVLQVGIDSKDRMKEVLATAFDVL